MENSKKVVEDLIDKLKQSLQKEKQLIESISFGYRFDYDFNYSELIEYSYFNCDALCDDDN